MLIGLHNDARPNQYLNDIRGREKLSFAFGKHGMSQIKEEKKTNDEFLRKIFFVNVRASRNLILI